MRLVVGVYLINQFYSVRSRRFLWSEYLEVSDHILSGPRPTGGWLGLWKKIAADNVTSLKGPEPTMKGRILPYSAEANLTKQLETFGIPFDELDVVAEPLLPPLKRSITQTNFKKKEGGL